MDFRKLQLQQRGERGKRRGSGGGGGGGGGGAGGGGKKKDKTRFDPVSVSPGTKAASG